MTKRESVEPAAESRDWIVVHSRACRIALRADDPFEKWYPEGKLIAKGLSKTEAQAWAYFPERKFDMSKMSELVAEYNNLTGKSIKKFATVAKGEAAVAKLRAKKPKTNGQRKGRQPAFSKITAFTLEGRRMNSTSRRSLIYNEVIKLGPKNVELESIKKKFGDVATGVLRQLAGDGWVELS